MAFWQNLKDSITGSQVWKSMFRHDYKDTRRNRALQILNNVFLHLHPVTVARHATKIRFTWCMGGITFLMFLICTVTGVLLMFYYRPTPEYAYKDITHLAFDVSFGPLLRNMHRWAAHGMVIAIWLHMLRVFMTGSYKKPREFNWGVGVVLLVLTLFLSFTGYLLPWDQLAFWAVTVGTTMAKSHPGIGAEGPLTPAFVTQANDIRFVLLGGTTVGEVALLRFYVLHCIFVPLIASVLMAVHFWRVRKDGGISGPM